MRHLVCLMLVPLLAACWSSDTPVPPLPKAEAYPPIDVGQVAIRIKQEIGYYQATQPKTDAEWLAVFKQSGLYNEKGEQPPRGICGTGKIVLSIKKVQLDLLGSSDITNGVAAGIKLPVGPPMVAADIKPGATASRENIGSVEFKHTFYVPSTIADDEEWQFLRDNKDPALLKAALEGLRNGLIASTGHRPCLLNAADQPNPDPETAVFTISAKHSDKSDLGFDIFVVNVDVSNNSLYTRSNTITVTYVPSRT